MKQIALYIILFSYSIVMLKPVSPYVTDAVEHIFSYTKHMATVHYENGKYHVHKELVDNTKKNEPAKEVPAAKKVNSANDHITMSQNQSLQFISVSFVHQIPTTSSLLNNYLAGEFPPPRA